MSDQVEKGEKKLGPAGERNRKKLLAFLSDFENEWPKRQEYSTLILGYKLENQIYKTLTPHQITSIENEALEIIKAQSSKQRRELYKQLHTEGKKGNVTAIKECLVRTEGKVVERKEITGKDGGKIEVSHSSIDLDGAKAAYDG